MQLRGQVALITGAGRGIGKAIALRFAREGADIAVFDLNDAWARGTSEEIKTLGRKAFVKTVDVSNCEEVQAAVHEAAAVLGRLDVIINNAGTAKPEHFLKITKENWEHTLQVDLFGAFYCSQAAAQEMVKQKYGRIINIASMAGLIGPIDLAPYGTAKAGITGLTRAAALDLADYGITVNAIAPGPIYTELIRLSSVPIKDREQHIPVARLGAVHEVAHAALFLASLEAGFITGTVLNIDGGSVAAGAYMVELYRRRKAISNS